MEKSLADWLRDIERLHPAEIELGLERIQRVYASLPQLSQPSHHPTVISVAGTNGKGSTVRALEAMGLCLGKRIGSYTSPHLLAYNERVQINQQPVADELLVQAFNQVEQARADIPLTYFEFGTLAALVIFAEAALDWVLLEVGLGGRLDAVNIVDADVAVVTSVDFDHEAWLGNTREAIGREKAGIIRDNGLFICGDPQPPTSLTAKASEAKQTFWYGEQFGVREGHRLYWQQNGRTQSVALQELASLQQGDMDLPILAGNLAIAVQTIAALEQPVNADLLDQALPIMTLPGRQQMLTKWPFIMVDVGHNPQAAASLAQTLQRLKECYQIRACYCLLAMLQDKNHSNTIAELLPYIDGWWVTEVNAGTRTCAADNLAELLWAAGAVVKGRCATPQSGFSKIKQQLHEDELLVIFGSFYTVADILRT